MDPLTTSEMASPRPAATSTPRIIATSLVRLLASPWATRTWLAATCRWMTPLKASLAYSTQRRFAFMKTSFMAASWLSLATPISAGKARM